MVVQVGVAVSGVLLWFAAVMGRGWPACDISFEVSAGLS
jgi:hypothetical protein